MVESRWLRWIGPGVVALGAVGLIASSTLGAGDRPWTPQPCAQPPDGLISAVREPGPRTLADLGREPWYRMDPLLDATGELRGQRLAVGPGADAAASRFELERESFAAGPFGRIVLVGSDDGSTSSLRAYDVARECAWSIAVERDVIRRATVDPGSWTVFETRVDRASRADLGVWSRPLDGSVPARRVLAPLATDDRFGRTFSTEFSWDASGVRLAVQACGEVACRTRILGPGDDLAALVDDPELGPLLGVDGDLLVSYGACRGLACPILATDVTTGARRVLASEGGAAVVLATPDGTRLVHEIRSAGDVRLQTVGLDGTAAADLGTLPDGLRLHRPGAWADAAMRLPTGWILLAPDGRLPLNRETTRPRLRHLPDGATVLLDEAIR